MRCVSQYDLAQSHVELSYKYMAIRKHNIAQMYLQEALLLFFGRHDAKLRNNKAIKHSQLHEQLADLSVELHQYNKGYQYIKMSMKCCQEQKYMLLANFELRPKDIIMYIKHNREWEKLEIRGQMLENKMNYIKQLMTNSDVDNSG
jgi:hypothetical protein